MARHGLGLGPHQYPGRLPELHKHPFAEIVLSIGFDPDDITALGGEVTWGMGEGDDAETFILTKTTAVYVPAGLPHGPAVYDRDIGRPDRRHRPRDGRVPLRLQ